MGDGGGLMNNLSLSVSLMTNWSVVMWGWGAISSGVMSLVLSLSANMDSARSSVGVMSRAR